MARNAAVIGKSYAPKQEKNIFKLEGGTKKRVIWAVPFSPRMPDGSDAPIEDDNTYSSETMEQMYTGVYAYDVHNMKDVAVDENGKAKGYATINCIADDIDPETHQPYGAENCIGCYHKAPLSTRFGAVILVRDENDEWVENIWYFSNDVFEKLQSMFALKYAGKMAKTVGRPIIVSRGNGQMGKYSVELAPDPKKLDLPIYNDPDWRPTTDLEKVLTFTPRTLTRLAKSIGIPVPAAFQEYLSDESTDKPTDTAKSSAKKPSNESDDTFDFE